MYVNPPVHQVRFRFIWILILFQVTICGGGNLAHFSAAIIGANPAFRVNVLTRKPSEWKKTVTAYTKNSAWESKGDIVGK